MLTGSRLPAKISSGVRACGLIRMRSVVTVWLSLANRGRQFPAKMLKLTLNLGACFADVPVSLIRTLYLVY